MYDDRPAVGIFGTNILPSRVKIRDAITGEQREVSLGDIVSKAYQSLSEYINLTPEIWNNYNQDIRDLFILVALREMESPGSYFGFDVYDNLIELLEIKKKKEEFNESVENFVKQSTLKEEKIMVTKSKPATKMKNKRGLM